MTDGAPAPRALRVLVAQVNPVVGDVDANARRIVDVLGEARRRGVDVAVFPELVLCGYPPEDLLVRPGFVAANQAAIAAIAAETRGLTALVGFPHHDGDLYNAAAVLHDGAVADVYHKAYLPNYGVFDEVRYFAEGRRFPVYDRGGVRIGVSICEDIWYAAGPPQLQALAGAEVLVNLSASPYHAGKAADRERMLATRAADTGAFVVYCNLVGGQDELLFDGNSLVLDPDGRVLARGASLAEDLVVVDLRPDDVFRDRLLDPRIRKARLLRRDPAQTPRVVLPAMERAAPAPPLAPAAPVVPLDGPAEVYAALVLGTRDYTRKNGFGGVVLGLSGGIDSALAAAVAVDALGPANVVGVAMPTRYTSAASLTDAADLAALLGIRCLTVPIDGVFQAYLDMLAPVFEGRAEDVTEENLQPRVRGNILMALSNKFGWMVLTTGNKSELSVGYATLYGDMAGGFAPLKDVPKTLVYALARWRNAQPDGPRIPEHSITRAPSAELKPGQLDSDSLPPYDVLDPIVEAYVERELGVAEIAALGFDHGVVARVARMIDTAEYKRRQAAPGIKITSRAFGRERRMPITKRDSSRG
ncbi:NAD+ synthase [bacterium]|nr:MAG: NAD+ synthase [bacterium]